MLNGLRDTLSINATRKCGGIGFVGGFSHAAQIAADIHRHLKFFWGTAFEMVDDALLRAALGEVRHGYGRRTLDCLIKFSFWQSSHANGGARLMRG